MVCGMMAGPLLSNRIRTVRFEFESNLEASQVPSFDTHYDNESLLLSTVAVVLSTSQVVTSEMQIFACVVLGSHKY